MTIVLRLFSALAFLVCAVLPAGAGDASLWSDGLHSRVRLLSGGEVGRKRLAGLEIVLDSGFKTYWRTPGESGLPPRFDWSGSDNVADVEVRWPAPTRLEDAGGVAYIYSHEVVLPLLVTPQDPSRPVRLTLTLDFGVCKDICIPAHAEATLDLTGKGGQAAIEVALDQVPKRQPLGADLPLSILAVTPQPGDKPSYRVRVRAQGGGPPSLFAEGPEDWYLSTSLPDGDNGFTVTVDEKPADAGEAPIVLTLTAGGRAVETELHLDGRTQPR
jgi:DsbC/DsbD-like thiol-disulfide interchange protein